MYVLIEVYISGRPRPTAKKYVLIYLADEEIYPNTSIWLLYDLGESVTVSSIQIDLPYHLGE